MISKFIQYVQNLGEMILPLWTPIFQPRIYLVSRFTCMWLCGYWKPSPTPCLDCGSVVSGRLRSSRVGLRCYGREQQRRQRRAFIRATFLLTMSYNQNRLVDLVADRSRNNASFQQAGQVYRPILVSQLITLHQRVALEIF